MGTKLDNYIAHIRTCIRLAVKSEDEDRAKYWYGRAKVAYNRDNHIDVLRNERKLREIEEVLLNNVLKIEEEEEITLEMVV
jgi:hypothetical protein